MISTRFRSHNIRIPKPFPVAVSRFGVVVRAKLSAQPQCSANFPAWPARTDKPPGRRLGRCCVQHSKNTTSPIHRPLLSSITQPSASINRNNHNHNNQPLPPPRELQHTTTHHHLVPPLPPATPNASHAPGGRLQPPPTTAPEGSNSHNALPSFRFDGSASRLTEDTRCVLRGRLLWGGKAAAPSSRGRTLKSLGAPSTGGVGTSKDPLVSEMEIVIIGRKWGTPKTCGALSTVRSAPAKTRGRRDPGPRRVQRQ